MTDPIGIWRLTLAGEPSDDSLVRVEIRGVPLGGTDPSVAIDEIGIGFHYTEGRRTIWPWTSLLRADYEPAADRVVAAPRDPGKPSL